MPKKVIFFEKKEVIKVCAGQFHSLALTADNELFAWGKGQYGRLGINSSDTKGEPQKVIFSSKNADGKTPIKDTSLDSEKSEIEML